MYMTAFSFLFIAITPDQPSLPSDKDFANYVAAEIPSKWKHVAIQLGLRGHKCMAIKKNEDDCFDQFMAVFSEWEKGTCEPFTWTTLIAALQSPSVDEVELANRLKQVFCS